MDMSARFRGFLPVVIDIETGGFNARRHAVLEIAAVFVEFNGDRLRPCGSWDHAVKPYPGSQIEEASLKVTGINLDDPNRNPMSENEALLSLFKEVRAEVKRQGCHRAIMVAHNAMFDQQFLQQTIERTNHKRSPFHPFSFIDTASISAIAYGHTVLAEACRRAEIEFDGDKAHNALYDAQQTAELFCSVVNGYPFDERLLTPSNNGDQD